MIEIVGAVAIAVVFFVAGLFVGRKHAAAVNTVATAAEAVSAVVKKP